MSFKKLLNIIKNITEDYETDKTFRKTASELIEKIQKKLSDGSARLLPYEYPDPEVRSYKLDVSSIDDNFDFDIVFLIPPEDKILPFRGRHITYHYTLGDTYHQILLTVYDIYSETSDINKLKSVLGDKLKSGTYENYTSTLVHEITHYLDSARYKSINVTGRYLDKHANADNKLNPEDYFNSPHEYNAFFQGQIHELEKTLDRIGFLRREFKALKSIQSFIDWLLQNSTTIEFNDIFVRFLNDKYNRKLRKRLADYFLKKQSELIKHDEDAVKKNQELYGEDS